jgi:hypothetical protein
MWVLSNIGQWVKNAWYFTLTFFPVQLFLLHLRRSLILMVFWVVLFLFVSGSLGADYGFHYLFLSPEYLNEVSFISYFLLGVNAGLFVMAFHISSYIYYSYRYPFLATLSRPLYKFCINNSVIPILFYITYMVQVVQLLKANEHSTAFMLIALAGLLLGSIVTISITVGYFFGTIKSTGDKPAGKTEKVLERLIKKDKKRIGSLGGRTPVVNYYLKNFMSVKVTRGVGHYQPAQLQQTIQQHHFTASVYFVVLMGIILLLNFLGDYQVFRIPAGASIFLMFSLYLMVTGALYTRLKTWTLSVGIALLLLFNYLSGFKPFAGNHYAYGMDYKAPKANYSYAQMRTLTQDSIVQADIQSAIATLNKWKAAQKEVKPKLILLNVSGGGLRSSLWTLNVLQELDSIFGNDFYSKVHLISGSSGGMLGASYFRMLKYYESQDSAVHPHHRLHFTRMGTDLLNPVAYTLAVNDVFWRFRKFNYHGREYLLDRGKAFDDKLIENTKGFLEGSFGDWAVQEAQANIPTLMLAPTIIGDGRKLLMCNQGMSFLTFSTPFTGLAIDREFDAVEYKRLFARQGYADLRYATALRMSATFPYITPLVNLPSSPTIEVIDAGARDNEGFEIALRYVLKLENWIKENTSGVVFLQIKANRPDEIPIQEPANTNLDQLTKPIGGIVESFHNLQIYNKALLMELVAKESTLDMDVVRFSLFTSSDELSLSWHLTEGEKRYVRQAIGAERNREAIDHLRDLIE